MGRRLSVVARGRRRGCRVVRAALLAASRTPAHAADGRTGAVGGVRPVPLRGGRRGGTDPRPRGAPLAAPLPVAARTPRGGPPRARARNPPPPNRPGDRPRARRPASRPPPAPPPCTGSRR